MLPCTLATIINKSHGFLFLQQVEPEALKELRRTASRPSGQSGISNVRGSRDPILRLEVNGLYVLLSEQEVSNRWHWALYLHRGPSQGWTFHITRPTGFWFYDYRTSESVIYSDEVITALKIAVIDPDMHTILRDRLAQVPLEDTRRFGVLTCRTWLLQVLEKLDNEGHISITLGSAVEYRGGS